MKKQQAPKFGTTDYQDLALIESIKRGNQAAFTRLFKKYHPILHQKAFMALRNQDDADDIASEIFQKIFENIHKYKKEYTFNAWISTLAKNYIVDHIRKNKTDALKQSLSIDEPISVNYSNYSANDFENKTIFGDTLKSDVPEVMTASEDVERQAKLTIAYAAIEQLPDLAVNAMNNLSSFIFFMFDTEGRTPIEIAGVLQMELADVEDHIQKAYKRHDQGKLERKILEMYYLENKSYDEIAKSLKIKLNTMRVTLMRAKQTVINSIDVRQSLIEVASVYTMEQLDINRTYKLSPSI